MPAVASNDWFILNDAIISMTERWLNVKVVDTFTIFTAINSLPLKISYNKKGVVARSIGLLWWYNYIPATSRKYSSRASSNLCFFMFSSMLPTLLRRRERILSSITFTHCSASLYKLSKNFLFLVCSSLASDKMAKAWRRQRVAQNLDVVSLGVVTVIFPLGREGKKRDRVYNWVRDKFACSKSQQ